MSYKVDPAHSHVQFTVRHMMISKVRGSFEKFEGVFKLDESNPAASTVDVKIDANSINTREPQRDGHLRSADFLDVEKFPYVYFKSRKVEVLDKSHAKLYGDLTIKDLARPVILDVEYTGTAKSPWGQTSFGFEARTVIDRKDWNLNWNKALETGGFLVGDDITVDIELELIQVPEEQATQAAS